MRERVHGELETFAIQALALPGVDARRGHRGDSHAVADEQDNVACSPRGQPSRGDSIGAGAKVCVIRLRRGRQVSWAWRRRGCARHEGRRDGANTQPDFNVHEITPPKPKPA